MKKKLLIVLVMVLVVAAAVGGFHYSKIINATGSADIRYLEPEDKFETFADIISHPTLQNKVVYVDFWFTGCPYCRKEFKAMPMVRAHFKDNEDLVFLYLGKDRRIPGEKFRWKKMIADKNLTGVHYFMGIDQYQNIWKETVKDSSVTQGFPHFLIVDRKGTIVDDDAPWPSEPALIAALEEVLANP